LEGKEFNRLIRDSKDEVSFNYCVAINCRKNIKYSKPENSQNSVLLIDAFGLGIPAKARPNLASPPCSCAFPAY